jgi:hypothetical protein
MRTGRRFILEPPLDLDHCPTPAEEAGVIFGEMRDSGVPEKSSEHWIKVKNRAHPCNGSSDGGVPAKGDEVRLTGLGVLHLCRTSSPAPADLAFLE